LDSTFQQISWCVLKKYKKQLLVTTTTTTTTTTKQPTTTTTTTNNNQYTYTFVIIHSNTTFLITFALHCTFTTPSRWFSWIALTIQSIHSQSTTQPPSGFGDNMTITVTNTTG
jgi:hypothetical protein